MTAGILQLVARGYDDAYIIKEPEITYFKIIYRRYTNFAIYPKVLRFNDNATFGQLGKCKISSLGDLITKLYLIIDLPEINISSNVISIQDIQSTLNKYDISFSYDNNTEYISTDLYNLVHQAINNKISELVALYDSETNTLIKYTILKKLQNIAFNNNNHWTFPDLMTLIDPDFKNNLLSFDILNIFKTGTSQFAWVRELGHYLIEYMEIMIGGVVIDKHDSNILRCDTIINLHYDKLAGYNKLIGNVPELYDFNNKPKPKYRMYFPIKFWFSKHFSEALPIVSMPYSEVVLNVKFRDFNQVCYYNNYEFLKKPVLKTQLLAHYIYVEEEERKRIVEKKQEYLIEVYEINHDQLFYAKDIVESRELINNEELRDYYHVKYKISFDYLVKQMFWIIQPFEKDSVSDLFNKFNWNNFYNQDNKYFRPISNMRIRLNGRTREQPHDYEYFQYWQSYKALCASLVDNLFLYNFSLYPQEIQPSGQVNYGLIDDSNLDLYLTDELYQMMTSYNYIFRANSYAKSYNILQIHSGMAGLLFY